jgi:hypothetical protein
VAKDDFPNFDDLNFPEMEPPAGGPAPAEPAPGEPPPAELFLGEPADVLPGETPPAEPSLPAEADGTPQAAAEKESTFPEEQEFGFTAETPKTEEEHPEEEEALEEEEKEGFLERISKVSPYTVMLGIALAALLIAILCLLGEWSRYDYKTKAPPIPQGALFLSTAQRAPSTTAADCPIVVQLISIAAPADNGSGSPRITCTGHFGSGCS